MYMTSFDSPSQPWRKVFLCYLEVNTFMGQLLQSHENVSGKTTFQVSIPRGLGAFTSIICI